MKLRRLITAGAMLLAPFATIGAVEAVAPAIASATSPNRCANQVVFVKACFQIVGNGPVDYLQGSVTNTTGVTVVTRVLVTGVSFDNPNQYVFQAAYIGATMPSPHVWTWDMGSSESVYPPGHYCAYYTGGYGNGTLFPNGPNLCADIY